MADVAQLLETLHPLRKPPPPEGLTPLIAMTTLGCLLALSLFAAWWLIRARRGRLRRAAQIELADTRTLAPEERLAAQARLLRRIVRALQGEAIAHSQGNLWLQRLDAVFETRFFTEGDGRIYGDGLYQRPGATDLDEIDRALASLFAKVRA